MREEEMVERRDIRKKVRVGREGNDEQGEGGRERERV